MTVATHAAHGGGVSRAVLGGGRSSWCRPTFATGGATNQC